MRIGVFAPQGLPESSRVYLENVSLGLESLGAITVRFGESEPLPGDVELYWDPRAGWPYEGLMDAPRPVVITFHGAVYAALPFREAFGLSPKKILRGYLVRRTAVTQWHKHRDFFKAVIAVSSYAKGEVVRYFGIKEEKVFPIYHGVDGGLFSPSGEVPEKAPYLLHVSAYQPKKNLSRLFAAYGRARLSGKPRLVAIVPGYNGKSVPGVEIITSRKGHEELARYYRGAMGFLFPSLHETFGMPILEAMACGCPVITSDSTGCKEVAGDAAILVNPRSVDDIASAIRRLTEDEKLRDDLRLKGLERVKLFTWGKSAREHLRVFKYAIGRA